MRNAGWTQRVLACFVLLAACEEADTHDGGAGESSQATAADDDAAHREPRDDDAPDDADTSRDADGEPSPDAAADDTAAGDTASAADADGADDADSPRLEDTSQRDDGASSESAGDEAAAQSEGDEAQPPTSNDAEGDPSDDAQSDEAALDDQSAPQSCPDYTPNELRVGCWLPTECGGMPCLPPGSGETCIGTAPAEPARCWEPGAEPCPERFDCVEGTGCVALACETDGHCQAGSVCDPEQGVGSHGCRRGDCRVGEVSCDEPRERCSADTGVCEHRPCDDPEALPCSDGEDCNPRTGYCAAPGFACTWAGCGLLHCKEEGAFPCDAGTVCDPELNTQTGCRPVPCDQPGGFECGAGLVCDPVPGAEAGSGCRALHCSEAGASACPDGQTCLDAAPGNGCLGCMSDDDCACGICRSNVCRKEPAPGECQLMCP